MPSVSVFVTVHNREEFIRECIESVFSQTFANFEICVCDDGSTDKTPEILSELQKKHNTKKEVLRIIRHKKQKGMSAAYTTALSMCQGMYSAQLDSDDALYPHALEKLAAYLDATPTVGLVFSMCTVKDVLQSNQFDWNLWRGTSEETKKFLLTKGMTINHLRMFRRALLKGIAIQKDLTSAVDYDLYMQIAERTDIGFVAEPLYYYRLHEKNVSKPVPPFAHNPIQQLNATLVKVRGARRRLQKVANG